MAALVDASSPIRFTAAPGNPPFSITSASFTAPADSLIVCCVQLNSDSGANAVFTVTDSGTLSWTHRVARTDQETTAGGTGSIWTAPQVTSASRTVSVNWTSGGATSAQRATAKVYVVTGADLAGTPVDSVTGSNESGSLTNDYTTPGLTPGATGLLIGSDCDWQAGGAFDASDLTQDTVNYAGEMSVCSGYKVCTSGVSVTANWDGNLTAGCQHKECRIIVRQAVAAAFLATKAKPISQAVKRSNYF